MVGHLVLFDIGLLLGSGGQFMLEFFDKSSVEIHIDVFADLVEKEPVPDVASGHHYSNGVSGLLVIRVSNSS